MDKQKEEGTSESVQDTEESVLPEFASAEKEVKDSNEELDDPEGLEDIVESDEAPGEVAYELQLKEINDRYLRLAAEYDNYRKRTRKEKEDFHKFATADLIEKLLPVLDSLSRGVEFNAKAECVESVKEGLVKVDRLFREILQKEGLSTIEETSIPLDFNQHMAVFQEERSDVEDHTVLEIFEKGYSLRGKVLRPAKVKVSTRQDADSPTPAPGDSETESTESKSNE